MAKGKWEKVPAYHGTIQQMPLARPEVNAGTIYPSSKK
jgi:hypothetical protein